MPEAHGGQGFAAPLVGVGVARHHTRRGKGQLVDKFQNRLALVVNGRAVDVLHELLEDRFVDTEGDCRRAVGAVPERRGRVLAYEAIEEWDTGCAVVLFE